MALPVKPADVPEDLENPVRGEPRGTFAAKANEFLRRLVEDYTPALNEMTDWINATAIEIESIASDVESDANSASTSASSASDSKIYIDQVIGTLQQDIVINDTTPSYTEVFSSQTTLDNIEALIDDVSSVTDKTLSSSEIDTRIAGASAAFSAITTEDVLEGDLISFMSDSTAEKTKNITGSVITDQAADSTGTRTHSTVAKLSATKVAIVYTKQSDSEYLYGVIGDFNGSSFVFGTPQLIEATSNGGDAHACTISEDRFCIVFNDNNSTKTAICTVSGNTFTVGTLYELNAAGPTEPRCHSFDGSVVAYIYEIPNSIIVRLGAVSGSTITLGSASTLTNNGKRADISMRDNSKLCAVYTDDGNSSRSTIVSANLTGTAAAFGSSYALTSITSVIYNTISFTSDDQVCCSIYSTSTGDNHAYAATLSGNVASIGTPIVIDAGGVNPDIDKTDEGKANLVYSSSNDLKSININVSGNTVSSEDIYTLVSVDTGRKPSISVIDKFTSFISYENTTDSTVSAIAYNIPYNNASQWVGFAGNDALETELVALKSIGSVATNQTGISANAKYYLDTANSVLTTTNTGVKVGRGLTDSTLLITGSGEY